MTTLKKTVLSLLISVLICGFFYALAFIRLIDFHIPSEAEVTPIFIVSLFITVFLVIFFLFNLRRDPIALVQNRLKLLEASLVEQFFEHKEGFDKMRWNQEFELRRKEIINQLKQGIKASKKEMKKIDVMIHNCLENSLFASQGRVSTGKGLLMKAAAVAASTNMQIVKKAAVIKKEKIEEDELEIVSPFSSILHDLSKNDIIKVREGVHYVDGDALSPKSKSTAPSQTLNREFKELVDSVIT